MNILVDDVDNICKDVDEDEKKLNRMSVLSEFVMTWSGWLKEGSFYIHGLVYMLVRIAVNVTMVKSKHV